MTTKRKRGLGRGLDALLPKIPEATAVARTDKDQDSSYRVETVDPRKVLPNPYQPRSVMDSERLDDLAQSIKEQGVLQPVLVRKVGNRVEIIAGERRVRAAIQVGLSEVPVIVCNLEDEAAFEAALIENIQRENLSAIEEAKAYQRLVKEFGLTQEAIARKVGKSRVTIANALRLLNLPADVQDHIQRGEITAGHARALLACKTSRLAKRLAALILDRGISVREAEDWVRRQGDVKDDEGTRKGARGGSQPSPFAIDLQERMMGEIGLSVKIKELTGGSGRVEIHYADHDELTRLLERLGIDDV